MRIKKIEIIGFKSFCDRTVLTIDQPITAIVGPNGCGKSNIVDAIRWCMGEQSAKHLRGKAMDDVIFAGSETRGPAGMAEVSLTFENVASAFAPSNILVATDDGDDDASAEEGPHELGDAAVAERDSGEPDGGPAPAGTAPAGEEPARAASGETAPAGGAAEPSSANLAAAQAAALLGEDRPPIDFSQYGEVTITRRLFRDGTSEYLINKVPARLRDVQDFFLGTGVGTKAYSIIEQGRVGLIVSAKPEERRLLIEEAAGITKFKKKKQAAERKMEQTRQNLLRISDIVSEIEKQLGSLRRQAQKAERYKKYRAEVRDIEMWSASHRWLGFLVERQLFADHLAEVAAKRDLAHADYEAREARIVAERAEAALEEKRLSDLTQTVFDLENRIQLGESQIEFSRREAKDLEERASHAAGEIEGLTRQVEEAELELARVRDEAARLSRDAEARAGELTRLEEALQIARHALADAQGDLDAARAEISRAQSEIARAEGNQRSLERRRDDLELRRARLEEERGRISTRRAELSGAIAGLDQTLGSLRQLKLDLGVKKDELEERLARLRERAAQGEAEIETLRTELHRRRSRLVSLKEIQDRYEGFARGTRAVMQHRPGDDAEKRRIRGLVADIVEAPPEYEPAVEAVLGDRLGSILVESREVGVEAIDFLKKRAEGRSSFIPLVGIQPPETTDDGIQVVEAAGVRGPILSLVKCKEEYAAVADYLFRDVVVVESLPRALELWEAGLRKTIVTLDGDVLDRHGVVTGGSRDTAGAGILQQKREIRELEEICEGLERDLADATARHVATKAELAQVGAALDAVRKDSHQGEIAMLAHEKDLARFRAEAERLDERRAQLEHELDEIAGAMTEALRELEETVLALASARERAGEAERRQLGLIEGVTVARGAVEDRAAEVTECKVRLAQAQTERQAVLGQVGRLEEHAAELRRRIEKLERSIDEGRRRAGALREEADHLAVELGSLREERRLRAEELALGRNAHEQRMAALQVAEVEARGVRQEVERLGAEANRLEMKLQTLDAERRHLEEAIFERYRVELPREIHAYHLRPPVGEAEEARLKELRELIERMGEVNLTAISEFEELSKRYEYLTSQKQDLEQALATLEKAILKINKTSRRLFRETFDRVNAKFQEIFPKLFRGGHAELRLVGEEDLLDAGVEIFAQPPGKKNQTVDLLSGGEKALTAVALIFAIFLIKPSPFCLLDEVDAPLDEANVGRYNEMVRAMTDRSQFIVITHNKRTMEVADQLYGVTMEEPGCSKFVSVNLRGLEAKKKAA